MFYAKTFAKMLQMFWHVQHMLKIGGHLLTVSVGMSKVDSLGLIDY